MSKPPQTISASSLLDLRAITAEASDKLSKEGRQAVRGARASAASQLERTKAKARDPFERPSPGLVKRLAHEARTDAKRRHFVDDGPNDEQRRAILEEKARKYEQLSKGDYSGMSEREREDAVIDFDLKARGSRSDSDSYSDSDSESSSRFRRRSRSRSPANRNKYDTLDDLEKVEYVDDLGRTRMGTRREAREAERARAREGSGRDGPRRASPDYGRGPPVRAEEHAQAQEEGVDPESAYAEVQKSQFIYGEQAYFPVYQPDPEALTKKWMEAEKEARAHHYDSTKEVRTRGAGAYQFSLDEETRAAQQASLEAERLDTEKARAAAAKRASAGLSRGQEIRRKRLEARRAVVDAKRNQLLGGAENVARLREERRAAAAEKLLAEIGVEMDKPEEIGPKAE